MQNYLADLDLDKRILEIGPLAAPLLNKKEANVFYADILPTKEIKAFYQNEPEVDKDAVCEIDFVIRGSYAESLKNVAKFDYIISCHVLEHMPRLLDFFQDAVNILNPQGKIYALLPDCRYCFDHFRSPTSFAELYYIHTQGLKFVPWQVLDSHMAVPLNDPRIFATEKKLFHLLTQRQSFDDSKNIFQKSLAGEYVPGHFSTFTPESFLLLLHESVRAGILPFKLVNFFPTSKYDFTFAAVLEACPELLQSSSLSENEMGRLREEMVKLVDYEEQQARRKYPPVLLNNFFHILKQDGLACAVKKAISYLKS